MRVVDKTLSKIAARKSKKKQPDQLLYSRHEVARMLGCSPSTVCKLENAGKLKPVYLATALSAKTYYRAREVLALAGM